MMPLIFSGLLVGCDPGPINSYLFQPAYCIDEVRRLPATPYEPQPGDLMFATDDKVFWKIMHNLAGTGHPHHSGVVFRRSDGRLAVLEGGPYDTLFVGTIDAPRVEARLVLRERSRLVVRAVDDEGRPVPSFDVEWSTPGARTKASAGFFGSLSSRPKPQAVNWVAVMPCSRRSFATAGMSLFWYGQNSTAGKPSSAAARMRRSTGPWNHISMLTANLVFFVLPRALESMTDSSAAWASCE